MSSLTAGVSQQAVGTQDSTFPLMMVSMLIRAYSSCSSVASSMLCWALPQLSTTALPPAGDSSAVLVACCSLSDPRNLRGYYTFANIFPEVEHSLQDSISFLCDFHVFINLGKKNNMPKSEQSWPTRTVPLSLLPSGLASLKYSTVLPAVSGQKSRLFTFMWGLCHSTTSWYVLFNNNGGKEKFTFKKENKTKTYNHVGCLHFKAPLWLTCRKPVLRAGGWLPLCTTGLIQDPRWGEAGTPALAPSSVLCPFHPALLSSDLDQA